MGFDNIDKQFRPKLIKLECARCQATAGVEMENSRTQYPDPADNAPVPLCRDCAQEHHAHWDAMWADYQAGLL